MNIFAAIVSGLIGALAVSLVMALAPMMGMPKMDIVGMLSTMFGKANKALGWMMHLMMGVIFALIYAFLWSQGIGAPAPGSAVLFGTVHWLVVGMGMMMVPMMHAGIKSGEVAAPGAWMTKQGGMMALVGGLLSHIIFALVVVLVYKLF
ncbi:MAG: hypothetical protein ACRDFQ_01895 [Anaerolineales bacterium]